MRTETRAAMQALFLHGQRGLWRESCGGILTKLHDTVLLEFFMEGPSGDAQTPGRFTLATALLKSLRPILYPSPGTRDHNGRFFSAAQIPG